MLKPYLKTKAPDWQLMGLVIGVCLFGLVMIYNASVFEAWQIFGDKYHFLKMQSFWLLGGILVMLAAIFLPLNWIKRAAPYLFLFNLILLVAVLIPGIGQKSFGARRWLDLGWFSPQPTELAKLFLSIYLAAWLAKARPLLHYLLILAPVLTLIMLQPDLGTATVIILTSFAVYLVSGARWWQVISLIFFGAAGGAALIFGSAYRRARIMTFLDPTLDPLGSSYHIRQALMAIGSGGWLGLGLGQSRQKYQFLPEATTDSIFAVIAEETGFFGSVLVIGALFLIIFKAFKIAAGAEAGFPRLLATALAAWIGIQTVINLGAMLALLPLTGVPLPFISYGGSSLIILLAAVGLLLNISRFQINPKKI